MLDYLELVHTNVLLYMHTNVVSANFNFAKLTTYLPISPRNLLRYDPFSSNWPLLSKK